MFKILFIVLIVLNLYSATLQVASASNVAFILKDIIKEFNETYPNIKIKQTINSSGALTSQIEHFAPYDIFLSANIKYAHYLKNKGFSKSKIKIYAIGEIVLFSTKKIDFKKGLDILNDKSIKTIAIADYKKAPYGKAAFMVLKNTKLFDKVKNKLVFGNSISQTLSFTIKATDVGFVAKSALFSKNFKKYKKNINWIDIDKKFYSPIKQAMIRLNNKKETKLFFDFLLSEYSRKIFKQYGYKLP